MRVDNGGSAFPSNNHPTTQAHEAVLGMSLRDYFAGQVVGSLLGSELWLRTALQKEDITSISINKFACRHAYEVADTMIAERNKETT